MTARIYFPNIAEQVAELIQNRIELSHGAKQTWGAFKAQRQGEFKSLVPNAPSMNNPFGSKAAVIVASKGKLGLNSLNATRRAVSAPNAVSLLDRVKGVFGKVTGKPNRKEEPAAIVRRMREERVQSATGRVSTTARRTVARAAQGAAVINAAERLPTFKQAK